ncbi:MAG: hypothetical protein ACL93V_06390 [Candidatus Electrothrix sp. YB6]
MIVKWHDRKDVKAHFADWKNSDDPFLLLHIPDTQEIRDARIWMKTEATPLRFVAMQHSSDARIVKDIFLKELAEELDGSENFPLFYQEFNRGMTGYFPAAMQQGVGNHAQAGDEFSAEEISQNQNVNLVINELPSLNKLREENIEKLFDLFLLDFQQSLGTQQILLSFQFLKAGFQDFSDDTRQWLRRLYRNLARKGHVKICIVNQGELDELLDFDTEHVETISPYLRFDDIVQETGDEAFCSGLAEPPHGKISYKDFKHKYAARLKRQAVAAS